MVEIAEIEDREGFEAWLEQEDLPRKAMVTLAHRAAMRVLPVVWRAFALEQVARSNEVPTIVLFRAALWSIIDFQDPNSEQTMQTRWNAIHAEDKASLVLDAAADLVSTAADDPLASNREMVAVPTASRAILAASDAAFSTTRTATLATSRAVSDAALATGRAARMSFAAADSVAWAALRDDCLHSGSLPGLIKLPIWGGAMNPLEDYWQAIKTGIDPALSPEWAFWLDWYERALYGTERRWALLRDIALLDRDAYGRDIWEGPERVAAEIARLEAGRDNKTDLARAYPVDFTFDAMARVMRMVGIHDDMAHLRDPAVVQVFLDDCDELRDTLGDFADFAKAGSGGSNRSGMLQLAAEKVLAELTRTADDQHLRARHIVRLAQRLESFAKEKGAREELGETLAGVLDEATTLLQTVTRKHFGPAYTALAPLSQLSLDQIDRDAVLDLFDAMIARMEALPTGDLLPLDEDGLSVFRDMIRELHDFRAAIAEASTDEFRAMMESRFAESIGGTGIAFGRFLETSATAAGHVGAGTDAAIKTYKRVTGLKEIVAFIAEYLGKAS